MFVSELKEGPHLTRYKQETRRELCCLVQALVGAKSDGVGFGLRLQRSTSAVNGRVPPPLSQTFDRNKV